MCHIMFFNALVVLRNINSNLKLSKSIKLIVFKRLLSTVDSECKTGLKGVLEDKVIKLRRIVPTLKKEFGNNKISNVSIHDMYENMKDKIIILNESEDFRSDCGSFKKHTIQDISLLPTAGDGKQPLPESMLWLLLTGDIPKAEQITWLNQEFSKRAALPHYIVSVISSFSTSMPPHLQLSTVITILSTESKFRRAYTKGINKNIYWEYYYEDAMDLIAKLPIIATLIYQHTYRGGGKIGTTTPHRDWCSNFADMLQIDDKTFKEFLRLYLVLNSTSGGSVMAFASKIVSSALSDIYLAVAAGLHASSGDFYSTSVLKGITLLQKLYDRHGLNANLKEISEEILNLLSKYDYSDFEATDNRQKIMEQFKDKYVPRNDMFDFFTKLSSIAVNPKNTGNKPFFNLHTQAAIIFKEFNIEYNYLLVLLGMSRCLGTLTSLVWDRALTLPIIRPKSFTTNSLIDMYQKNL